LKLAERIGVSKDFKHPEIYLYKPGNSVPIQYPTDKPIQATALTSFVAKHTSFFYGLPGLVASLEKYSDKFVLSSEYEKEELLRSAEEDASKFSEPKDKENAKYYIKVMKNIIKSGNRFVLEELKRLQKIIDSEKISEPKKKDAQRRLNILTQFDRSDASDEL